MDKDKTNHTRCSLHGSDIRASSFKNSKFSHSTFHGSDLRHSDFNDSEFKECNFSGSDFRYANFENAIFIGVNFNNADMRHTTMPKVRVPDIAPEKMDDFYKHIMKFFSKGYE